MSKTIASLICVGIFSILALAERAPSIENELTQEAKSTLNNAKLNQNIDVVFDGRDGTITGEEQDRANVEKGAELVRAINGVRVVDIKLRPNIKRTKAGVFKLIVQANGVKTNGTIGKASTQMALNKAIEKTWPKQPTTQSVKVDRETKLLPDVEQGVQVFGSLKPIKDLILTWSDSGVKLEGTAKTPGDKDAITQAFKTHYPGHSLQNNINVEAHRSPLFTLSSTPEQLTLGGRVANEATKKALYSACVTAWPNHKIINQLQIDPQTKTFASDVSPANTVGNLARVKTLNYSWSPEHIVVGGWVDTADTKAKLNAALNLKHNHVKDQTMVAPKATEIKQAQRNINQYLRGKTIAFETGSDVPTAATIGVLKQTAQLLKKYPNTLIDVQGHTDNQGKPSENQTLSQKRAAAAVKQLVSAGIETHRLFPSGYGDTKPIASNKTANGRAQNRRVVFFVKGAN